MKKKARDAAFSGFNGQTFYFAVFEYPNGCTVDQLFQSFGVFQYMLSCSDWVSSWNSRLPVLGLWLFENIVLSPIGLASIFTQFAAYLFYTKEMHTDRSHIYPNPYRNLENWIILLITWMYLLPFGGMLSMLMIMTFSWLGDLDTCEPTSFGLAKGTARESMSRVCLTKRFACSHLWVMLAHSHNLKSSARAI